MPVLQQIKLRTGCDVLISGWCHRNPNSNSTDQVYLYVYVCVCVQICMYLYLYLCLHSETSVFSVLSRHKCPNTLMQATLFNPPCLTKACTTIYPHKTLGYSICNKSRWDCTSVPLSLGSRKGGEGGRHKDSRTMSRSLATSIGSLSYNPDCKIIWPLSYNPAFPACKIIRPLWFILQSLSWGKVLSLWERGTVRMGS